MRPRRLASRTPDVNAVFEPQRGGNISAQASGLGLYDGFGRMTEMRRPDGVSTQPSDVATLKVEYQLGSPVSKLRSETRDDDGTGSATYHETLAFVDGLGRTVVTLSEADPEADGHAWIAQGLTDYDKKGAERRKYLAWWYDDPPQSYDLSAKATTLYGQQRYDAFGRAVETIGLDGTVTMATKYHALSVDAWDAEDIGPGDHQGTYASEVKDGHGRVVRTTERVREGEHRLVESRHVDMTYLATGEPTSITRRAGTNTPVTRTMSYDSLGRMVENIEASTSHEDQGVLHTWRYAYSAAGDLVGTSDARGCGTNYYYEASGRLTIEDYAPCEDHHAAFTPFVPEVLYTYDALTSGEASTLGISPCFMQGRLVSVIDRAGKTLTCFDSLGRTTAVARQLTTPSGQVGGRWYHRTAQYDTADRPVKETTGASEGAGSFVTTDYTKRGTVGSVGSSYGSLVNRVRRDADGLVQEIEYGDAAATTTGFMYDELRRLRNLTTYRSRPELWPQTGTGTQQLLLQDEQYTYDRVGNPTEIRDWRIASEWDAGAKPVTRKMLYDDLYRLSRIDYQYPQGSDDWVDPFDAEVSDNNRPQPSPRADFSGAKRPLWQTYAYDWLGNTLSTDDDAHAFYDRSLGTVANDGYRIAGADNSTKGGTRTGNLSASYDSSGNLVAMDVHREADCIPAGKCTNQHFEYQWDEVGRLVRARRFDMANPPSGTPPDAELSYRYDASDNRVLKTVGDHYTAYIFGSLELRSTTFDGDYVVSPETETAYLQAHGVRLARVVHSVPDPYELSTTRVFLELGDELGSTSVVLDLASGELVERSTAYAYGATESDYRADRWGKFREDYRFTGKEEDIEVGLQYFGKRFYAPLLQRWVSADPLAVHAPGQADLNLYAYVHGRVLVAVDPVGLQEKPDAANAGCEGGGNGSAVTRPVEVQAAYDQGAASGRAHAQVVSDAEDMMGWFTRNWGGGPSVWDGMSTAERMDILGKIEAKLNSVQPAPTFSDAARNDAVREGFEDGARVGYAEARNRALAVSAGFELLKLAAIGGGSSADRIAGAMTRALTRASRMLPAFGVGAGGIGVIPQVTKGTVPGAGEVFGIRLASRTGIGFKTFEDFKLAFGEYQSAHWHHIVEQNSGNVGRFGAEAIHNTNNMMLVDDVTHGRISGFYSSIQSGITGSDTMTVRQWLSTQPFEAQHDFGISVLQRFGVTK